MEYFAWPPSCLRLEVPRREVSRWWTAELANDLTGIFAAELTRMSDL